MRTAAQVFILLVLMSVAWQTLTAQEVTQPAETTPEVVSLTPSLTPTSSPTATPSLTPTPTATATATPELTVEVTEETSPTAEVTSEATATYTPEVTDEPVATAEVTAEVTDDTTPLESATPTLTITATPESTSEATPELTVEVTQDPSPTLDFRFMPTATVGIPMTYITGTVSYQNRLPDNSGITIYIANGDWVMLSLAVTDSNGAYTIAVPTDTFYWLVAEGPLHKRYQLGVWPGDALTQIVTLAGGDLNADGCIGALDIQVLTAYYDQPGSAASDITADGITDVADLAILTGNFNPDCEPLLMQSPTPTLTPELPPAPTETPSPEATSETTPELTPES